MSSSAIRPAATVLVTRDASAGLEVLLVQRAGELVFHGGAWVFPGGRVDAADGDDGEELAARRAAVRETHEEAGLVLQPDELVPLSHWTTPEGRVRRFATWFFVAAVDSSLECVVDGSEICAHQWLRPAEALAAQARGELTLPPPTFVSLLQLREFKDTQSLLSALSGRTPLLFTPRLHKVSDGEITVYREDAAYESGDLTVPGPRHRLNMLKSGFEYERSF